MTTLAEIETAAAALPPEEKQKLIRFLTSRLKSETPWEQQTDLTRFSGGNPLVAGSVGLAATGARRVGMTIFALSPFRYRGSLGNCERHY